MKHPVMHFEIMGHDAPKLRDFYERVFGWNVAAPIPDYEIQYSIVDPVPGFQRGIGGGIGEAPPGYDGHVTFYVVVDDVESAFAKVEEHGGTRMMGPDKVPNGPVIGLFNDPEGHTIGLVDPGDDMRGAPMELEPFVFFYGRCAEALEFYKKALDGDYEIRVREGDRVRIRDVHVVRHLVQGLRRHGDARDRRRRRQHHARAQRARRRARQADLHGPRRRREDRDAVRRRRLGRHVRLLGGPLRQRVVRHRTVG